MNSRRSAWLAALALVMGTGTSACAPPDEEGETRLRLTFEAEGPTPEHLRLTWVGEGRVFGDELRLPETGSLNAQGAALGTFEIILTHVGTRTLVARGMVAHSIVSEGAERVTAIKGKRQEVLLRLRPGRLPDRDDDGIPDEVDNCPGTKNRTQTACAQPEVDGGVALDGGGASATDAVVRPYDGGSNDAAAADATIAADATAPVDTAPAVDAGAAGDAAKLLRGKACQHDGMCETGKCTGGRMGRFCVSPDMVVVPMGPFIRGCGSNRGKDDDRDCPRDERPARIITLRAFEMDRTEVTQAAYDRCVQAGACVAPSANWNPRGRALHPVTSLSWEMADGYCRWAKKRLPTEAEWEKAARGSDDARVYPWGNDAPTCMRAQYDGCGLDDVVPVAVLDGASDFGAEDMAGNVSEWVADWYAADSYEKGPAVDPMGPATGSVRVRRGGSFRSTAAQIGVTTRASGNADHEATQGVRCVRDL